MASEADGSVVDTLDKRRDELLLKMYDQMFNDINRHILVNWQSVATLVGALAIFALTEKQVVSIDVATALVLLIAGWLIAHLYDGGYWYNRNLVIIANIERQFLSKDDLHNIHYYFGKHRPDNPMMTHLRIQRALGVGVGALVTLFHFVSRILPGFDQSWEQLELERGLPYITLIAVFVYVAWIRWHRNKSYQEFLAASPGIDIDTEGISYGVGHGHPRARKHRR